MKTSNAFKAAPHTRAAARFDAGDISPPASANLVRLGRFLFTVLFSTFLGGCTVLSYTSPQGEKFSRTSLGSTTAIGELVVEADSNGVRRVQLRGYTNDSTQALGVVTEAAVRAALQAAH